MKATGTNTAMRTSVVAMIGPTTSLIPSIVACIGFIPSFSISLDTFSTTTMASSTTMPNTMIKPNRDTMLMVSPMDQRMNRAPAREMGIPIPPQKESRRSINSQRRKNTRAIPIVPLRVNRLILARNASVLS